MMHQKARLRSVARRLPLQFCLSNLFTFLSWDFTPTGACTMLTHDEVTLFAKEDFQDVAITEVPVGNVERSRLNLPFEQYFSYFSLAAKSMNIKLDVDEHLVAHVEHGDRSAG